MFQEVVEAEGHLIDSHMMERIFDTVVQYNGKFEVEEFNVGKTNAEASHLRMKVETPLAADMEQMLSNLIALGCTPVDPGDAVLEVAEKDACAPIDFYSTTNHHTQIRHNAEWIDVENQRMDAMIVVKDGHAACRRLRDVKKGDQVVTGMRGIRVLPESKERGPSGVRVHEQRDLLRAATRHRRPPVRHFNGAGARRRTEDHRGCRPRRHPHRWRTRSRCTH